MSMKPFLDVICNEEAQEICRPLAKDPFIETESSPYSYRLRVAALHQLSCRPANSEVMTSPRAALRQA